MELRVLNYFYVVTQEGNMRKAADVLHVTQPTLSRQIMQLEEELHTKLFLRGKRGLELTEEGVLLQQNVKEILGMVEHTKQVFKESKNAVEGTLTIGIAEGKGQVLLYDAIEEFSKKYPLVRFDFYTGFGDDIKEKIDKGLFDLGLLMEPIETTKYECMRIEEEEIWGVLVEESDPLAQKETIDIPDLIGKPLIMPRRAMTRNEITNWFGSEQEKIHIFGTYNLISNLPVLTKKHMGYIICLDAVRQYGQCAGTKFIPFSPKRVTHSVLIWSRNRMFSTVTRLFLEYLREFFCEI